MLPPSLLSLFTQFRNQIPQVIESELTQYQRHYALLLEWNERINLVSRKSIGTAFVFHYVDCLFISNIASKYRASHSTFMDIGSGAGFPGLVFAIRYPFEKVSLFESVQKKRKFLDIVVSELGLTNVEVHGRFNKIVSRGTFMARASIRRDRILNELSKGLAVGSRLLVNSGTGGDTTPTHKSFRLITQENYDLPLNGGERRIEIFERIV